MDLECVNWYKLLNGVGLAFDMIGVVLLFRWSSVDIEEVDPRLPRDSSQGSDKIEKRDIDTHIVGFIKANLNPMIRFINKRNKENRRNASIAILLILLGFFFQGASLFI